MDPRTKDLTGKTIGQWTVISYAGIIKNNSYWNCICSCGFEKQVKAQYLLNGTSTKCQTCAIPKRKDITGTIPEFYWRIIKKNAIKRNIEIFVSKEECFALLETQNYKCAISGLDIYMSKNGAEYLEGRTTASLDRIDSSKSYEINNIQWVHKDVNMMKHSFPQEYFIKLCQSIVSHHLSYHDDQLE